MTKWIINTSDHWTPGDCYTCKIKCPAIYGVNPECKLVGANKAIEIKGALARAIKTQLGKPVTIYAVEKDGK